MDLIPLFSRIVVRRKEMTKVGNIIIPETTKQMQATEGVVIAIGDEVETIKKGDNIFFGRYSGCEVERKGEKFLIMNEEDVIAKIRI